MGSCISLGKKRKASGREERRLEGVNDVVVLRPNLTELRRNPLPGLYVFTFEEMRVATRIFSERRVLGVGGTSNVYLGTIDNLVREGIAPMNVAIKVINRGDEIGDDLYLNEVNFLGQLRHPNIVKVIGYCCEGSSRMVVYEYMNLGSVHKLLFSGVAPLTWSQRFKIALDAATGLAFIHSAPRQIIMVDFKPANILLDQDFNAKLSDFGCAKEGPVGDDTHVSVAALGTYGYIDPEYAFNGWLCAQCDVYGFGVFLLEMLSGRRAVDHTRPDEELALVPWGRPKLEENLNMMRSCLLDPRLSNQQTPKAITKIAKVAYECLGSDQMARPDMNQVLKRLQAAFLTGEAGTSYA